jgi:hypothetical protein
MAKSLGWLRGPRQLARVPTRGELHLQKFEFARYRVEVSACLIGWAQRQALGIARGGSPSARKSRAIKGRYPSSRPSANAS